MNTTKLFKYGVLPALVLQFFGEVLYSYIFVSQPASGIAYVVTKLVMVAWLVGVVWMGLLIPKFWKRDGLCESLWLGLLWGVFMAAVVCGAYLLFGQSADLKDSMSATIHSSGFGTVGAYVVFAIFLSVVHSLFEEVYWRWFVYGGLKLKLRSGLSLLFASLAFGAHHVVVLSHFTGWPFSVFGGLVVALGGYIWGYIYIRTGNIMGSWLSHILVDGVIMYVGYLLVFA